MEIDTIGTITSQKLLKVLFDPGSTKTVISQKALPEVTVPTKLVNTKNVTTLAGTMKTNEMVHLHSIKFPKFDKKRRFKEQKALVFDQKCRYDIILGSDFLTKIGIGILYSTGTMEWLENFPPMREAHKLNNTEYLAMADVYIMQIEEEELGDDWLNIYATNEILDVKYGKVDINEVVKNQTHPNHEQRNHLRNLFETHKTLFDGTLGVYPHKKFHIEVEKYARPHSRPYAVPHVHLDTLKKNYIVYLNWEFQNPKAQVNGLCPHLPPKKRMEEYAG